MDKLSAMRIFVRITETGNFSKTADEMNTSPSYISKQVSALEKSIGTRLFQRTTRALTLTEVGKSYLHHCQKILEQLSIAESEVSELLGAPSGLLRVSIPSVLGDKASAMMCAAFLKRYPEIELDIVVEDRFVDLVEEGIDVCIRATADFPDSTLIYRKVGDIDIHLMASKSYLDQHGYPRVASDLVSHDLISHRYAGSNVFEFDKNGRAESVRFNRRVRVNSTSFVKTIVEQGEGVGFLPARMASAPNARLVRLLPDYKPGGITISVVYPERTYTPLKVHKFIDFFDVWFQENYQF